jgi:bifunctional enzyme CysN/CysC
MSSKPMTKDVPYLIKHATQLLCCSITGVLHQVDVNSFRQVKADTLALNEIGLVEVETHKPMFFDSYSKNRALGNFIVIDPATNETVAAGVIPENANAPNMEACAGAISGAQPSATSGLVVWFTGLSGAGKSTICKSACIELLALGFRVEVLDADEVRKGLCSDLGFTKEDRVENVRRLGFVAQLLAQHGVIVLVAAISPYRSVREELRTVVSNFIEVFVNARLAVCEQRDPKGLYKRARNKEIKNFTGIDDPYEAPLAAEVECSTEFESITASTSKVVSAVKEFFAARSHKNIPVMGSHVAFNGERQAQFPDKGCMSDGNSGD